MYDVRFEVGAHWDPSLGTKTGGFLDLNFYSISSYLPGLSFPGLYLKRVEAMGQRHMGMSELTV